MSDDDAALRLRRLHEFSEKFDATYYATRLLLQHGFKARNLSGGLLVIWQSHGAIEVPTWYGSTLGGKLQPTLAGWWFGCVSLPLVQFILIRWYFRLFIWTRFLWRVARIELRLVPTHPDRAGGLGFLSTMSR